MDDIAILRVTNGSDLFCIVNASLTADTCAKVCSAFARAGNRQSADLRGITSSGFAGYSNTPNTGYGNSNGSSQSNSQNNSADNTGITNYAFPVVSDKDPVLHTSANDAALMNQTQLSMGNMTLKISHSSPVHKDKV